VIVKRISGFDSKESLLIEIENAFNLFHPCIFAPIGFIVRGESSLSRELKLVEFYWEGNSLSEVNSTHPVWWTATEKAKAVAGIILSLRFAHSHGLIHGDLTSKNIIFDMDHRIQITELYRIGDKVGRREEDRGGFLNEEWSPDPDVRSFISILFEIIVGHPAMLPGSVNTQEIAFNDIPEFVSKLITSGQSLEWRIAQSFNHIFGILKAYKFKIIPGVDSVDVLAFVDWVESIEQSVK
jgi:serine/threonine protein kinase